MLSPTRGGKFAPIKFYRQLVLSLVKVRINIKARILPPKKLIFQSDFHQ